MDTSHDKIVEDGKNNCHLRNLGDAENVENFSSCITMVVCFYDYFVLVLKATMMVYII